MTASQKSILDIPLSFTKQVLDLVAEIICNVYGCGFTLGPGTFITHTDRGISNTDFGDTAVDQGLASWIQRGVLVFGENYHSKVLVNDGNLTLTNYHTLDQSGNDKYDTVASEFVVPRLIIENSPSTPVSMYLRDQYFVNQSKVVNGYGGDKNTSNTNTTVSIHSADYSDD